MADFMDVQTKIKPFDGTVNVSFSDAMIASTKNAMMMLQPGKDPVFFIPFEDIYFDFLTKTNTTTFQAELGSAGYWSVNAVGEASENFMWAYETPEPQAAMIARHGAFDSKRARIEAVPREDWQHTPHVVE